MYYKIVKISSFFDIFLTQKIVCANILDKEDKRKGNKNLSDNIVRHQFMNLLVKAAKDKYITVLKQTKDNLEAAKLAFEKHFDVAIKESKIGRASCRERV